MALCCPSASRAPRSGRLVRVVPFPTPSDRLPLPFVVGASGEGP